MASSGQTILLLVWVFSSACASGRTYSSREAVELGLVGELTTAQTAHDAAVAVTEDVPDDDFWTRKEVARRWYAPTGRCGQGPWVITLASLRPLWGEGFDVEIYATHASRAFVAIRQSGSTAEASYGESTTIPSENDYCVTGGVSGTVSWGSASSQGDAGAGSGSAQSPGGTNSARAMPAVIAANIAQRLPLRELSVAPTARARGGYGYGTTTCHPYRDTGPQKNYEIVIWSESPLDLQDMVFEVKQTQYEPRADLTSHTPVAGLPAVCERMGDSRYARYRAMATTSTYVRPVHHGVPPAPRVEELPPRPSARAEWVAGSWTWGHADWAWIAGRWRIPTVDVAQGAFILAPSTVQRPAVRIEPIPPQPLDGAVWVQGYWQWSGQAYVWVPGSWAFGVASGFVWSGAPAEPMGTGVFNGGVSFGIGP